MNTSITPIVDFMPNSDLYDGMVVKEFELARQGLPVGPFRASIFHVAPDAMSPLDKHAVRECWLVLEGKGELTYCGNRYELVPKQLIYFDSHEPHQVHCISSTPLQVFSIWWPADE